MKFGIVFWKHFIKWLYILVFHPSIDSQVEYAHDNPLEEITLGEFSVTTMTSDEMPPEKPVVPETMDLETEKDPEPKYEVENDGQVDGKKTKKKGVKKEKANRKNMKIIIYLSHYVCVRAPAFVHVSSCINSCFQIKTLYLQNVRFLGIKKNRLPPPIF